MLLCFTLWLQRGRDGLATGCLNLKGVCLEGGTQQGVIEMAYADVEVYFPISSLSLSASCCFFSLINVH